MRTRSIAILFLLAFGLSVSAQYTKEFKRIFLEAEYLYQTEFYEEAISRYKNLLSLDPGNHNILFHCGATCLKIPGKEQQAVTYLKEASEGVTLDYKERSHKEPGAPVVTWFMLGQAHHLNNNFDEAIAAYERYQTDALDQDPLQVEYAGLQVESCERARLVVGEAPSFEFQSVLDQFDEDLPSCNNPVISGDGKILIFLVDYPDDKKIMMSEKKGQYWSRPRVINSEIGMVGETEPTSLSYDGQDLYLVHHFYSHSDIFVSRNQGGRWSEAEELGYNINGRTSETHASISKDKKTLFFTSDARGGEGSLDIWMSELDEDEEWGEAVNLGPVINTPYEEHTPFISSNDSILFFSSQGHSSIGGVDVYYSELGEDGTWGEPLSLGYPVNTTGDNVFFNPGWNELDGFYAVRREDDPTSNTINMVIELEPPEVVAELTEETTEESPAAAPAIAPAEAPVGQNALAHSPEQAIEPEETDEIHEALNQGLAESGDDVVASATVLPAGSTSLETAVPFDHNEYELSLAAMLEAEKVADLLQQYTASTVQLTGRADATGSADYNYLLSGQRAAAVADYLVMRGVERSRISLEGKGEDAPVALNSYADGSDAPLGRYLNRQVTIRVENPEPMDAGLRGFYVPRNLRTEERGGSGNEYWFTIQISASLEPAGTAAFIGVKEVIEYKCKDGYYRYASGKYRSFEDARLALDKIRRTAFPDAYIQTLQYYEKAAR